jgi:hypothetical protein
MTAELAEAKARNYANKDSLDKRERVLAGKERDFEVRKATLVLREARSGTGNNNDHQQVAHLQKELDAQKKQVTDLRQQNHNLLYQNSVLSTSKAPSNPDIQLLAQIENLQYQLNALKAEQISIDPPLAGNVPCPFQKCKEVLQGKSKQGLVRHFQTHSTAFFCTLDLGGKKGECGHRVFLSQLGRHLQHKDPTSHNPIQHSGGPKPPPETDAQRRARERQEKAAHNAADAKKKKKEKDDAQNEGGTGNIEDDHNPPDDEDSPAEIKKRLQAELVERMKPWNDPRNELTGVPDDDPTLRKRPGETVAQYKARVPNPVQAYKYELQRRRPGETHADWHQRLVEENHGWHLENEALEQIIKRLPGALKNIPQGKQNAAVQALRKKILDGLKEDNDIETLSGDGPDQDDDVAGIPSPMKRPRIARSTRAISATPVPTTKRKRVASATPGPEDGPAPKTPKRAPGRPRRKAAIQENDEDEFDVEEQEEKNEVPLTSPSKRVTRRSPSKRG